ncbi:MAG: hypothetical protein M3247_09350 [Thermoproteota archaeon]|nr:hypothetical protein [Thermoproteota archaeon]
MSNILSSTGSVRSDSTTVAVTTPIQQQAEAAAGCGSALPGLVHAFKASQGRCFHP